MITQADYDELVRLRIDGMINIIVTPKNRVAAINTRPVSVLGGYDYDVNYADPRYKIMRSDFCAAELASTHKLNISAAIAEYEREHKEDAHD